MAMSTDSSKTTTIFKLNNGTSMPAVGLGTYRVRSNDLVFKVVDDALAAGYRLFDTAAVYRNETFLNDAFKRLLPKYDLERDDIFITTKLLPIEYTGSSAIARAYQNSINNLGVDYVDLFLIHFPGLHKVDSKDKRHAEIRKTNWKALVQLYDDGRVNAIGVSNYTVHHLKDLIKYSHDTIPTVNQVEWHPFYYQNELLSFCKENDIVVQGYNTFGGASTSDDTLLTHPIVTKIAKKLEVTNAQVLLAWSLQKDVAVIPKSTNATHINQNIRLEFKIPPEDMKALDDLGRYNIKYAWDPKHIA